MLMDFGKERAIPQSFIRHPRQGRSSPLDSQMGMSYVLTANPTETRSDGCISRRYPSLDPNIVVFFLGLGHFGYPVSYIGVLYPNMEEAGAMK